MDTIKLNKILDKIVKGIDNVMSNEKASKAVTAFERLPLNMSANILRMANKSEAFEIINDNQNIEEGSGTLVYPKWFMRGLAIEWVKCNYEVKFGKFKFKNSQTGTVCGGKFKPIETVSEKVRSTALLRNIPSSAQSENLSDKTLTIGCNGCETEKRCAWRREEDYEAINICPCRKCLIKSMCKQYCDLLIQATKK